MPDLTPEDARRNVAGAHSLTCSYAFGRSTLCDCGGVTRPIAHLDAYAAAVRRDTLAKVREVVSGSRKQHDCETCSACVKLDGNPCGAWWGDLMHDAGLLSALDALTRLEGAG